MPFTFDTEHPVFLLAHEGKLDALREALSAEPDLAKLRATNGSSLLHFASESGHLEVVQWLLSEGGSKIDEKNQYGETALLFAARKGRLEVVKWLLTHKDISYRALLSANSQTGLKLDEAAQALITSKIESYELCIERANTDIPGFVFQETETHVLIKDELYCPISYELIEDPVVAADGVLYDKKHIEKWLNDGHDTSPKTGKKLEYNFTLPELSRKKELDDIHQAIERIYQQVRKRKSAFTSSEHIRKRTKSLPPSSRFFDDASKGDLTAPALSGFGAGM